MATIYVATEPDTVVDEMFGSAAGNSRMIAESQARLFSVSPLKMTAGFKLASIEHSKARQFGFDGHTYRKSGNFEHTRDLALRLLDAGFDGIHFSSRRPLTKRVTLAALFLTDDAATRELPVVPHGEPIPGTIAAANAGFSIEPWHLLSHLDLI